MKQHWSRKIVTIISIVFGLLAIFMLVQFLVIKYNGKSVPVPTIPRTVQVFGTGETLKLVVLGDSTAVGQGGEYSKGIAVSSAKYIASSTGRSVAVQNFAVSGARVNDVLNKQLTEAIAFKPDAVLLAVGANDVTHLTGLDDVEADSKAILAKLQQNNPSIKVVVTGSPQMGAVPRFIWPVDYAAANRTKQINTVFSRLSNLQSGIVFAPIAKDTGDYFAAHPELFAPDKFHPNTAGYAVWNPTLQRAFLAVFDTNG